jgi:hypothetical protein
MKNLSYMALLLSVIATLPVGCEESKTDLPIEFGLRLLDTLGNEKTEFNEGENIIFSFLVTNNSNSEMFIRNFISNDSNFFRVYGLNSSKVNIDYGTAIDIVCEIGGFNLEANGFIDFKCPWVISEKDENYHYCISQLPGEHETFLPVGNYYTTFKQKFTVGSFETEEMQFEVEFSVK